MEVLTPARLNMFERMAPSTASFDAITKKKRTAFQRCLHVEAYASVKVKQME